MKRCNYCNKNHPEQKICNAYANYLSKSEDGFIERMIHISGVE